MTALGTICKQIRLIVLDVDGVLTPGLLVPATPGASEWKCFHVRDGLAMRAWQYQGGQLAILTGRGGPAVEARSRELGVRFLKQGANPKTPAYESLLSETGIAPHQVCCIGDDAADIPLLRSCGLGIAVADACVDARRAALIVTRANGGQGAVREALELIMRCQGNWTAA